MSATIMAIGLGYVESAVSIINLNNHISKMN